MNNMESVSLPPASVRAILAGRKTQLRLVHTGRDRSPAEVDAPPPLGAPGNLLWVREPWYTNPPLPGPPFESEIIPPHEVLILYKADVNGESAQLPGKDPWYPSKTMPRWASRLTIQVGNSRLESLQAIGEADLQREGGMWRETGQHLQGVTDREGFARWWNSTHPTPGGRWEDNPLVWAVSFKVVLV